MRNTVLQNAKVISKFVSQSPGVSSLMAGIVNLCTLKKLSGDKIFLNALKTHLRKSQFLTSFKDAVARNLLNGNCIVNPWVYVGMFNNAMREHVIMPNGHLEYNHTAAIKPGHYEQTFKL